jgi:hypothetical protein
MPASIENILNNQGSSNSNAPYNKNVGALLRQAMTF